MSEKDSNRREHQRISVNKEFESVDEFVSEYVTNISKSGVFIRAKRLLPVGTLVNLSFSVLTDDFETIEGIGRVVRLQEKGELGKGMGVVFQELTPESRKIVETLVAQSEANADDEQAPTG